MARLGIPGFSINSLAYVDSRLATVPVVEGPRSPTVNDRNYPTWTEWRVSKNATGTDEEGDFWKLIRFESNGDATWVKFNESSTGPIVTFSDTANTKTGGDVNGNIRLYSPVNILSGVPTVNILTDEPNKQISFSLPDGPETACADYIVFGGDGALLPAGYKAGYETIQSALDAAPENSTIFVKEGTYTEALTISKHVTITAFAQSDRQTPPNVIIQGTSGNPAFTKDSGIRLQVTNVQLSTNGANIINNISSSTVFVDCRVRMEDGVTTFNNSSSSDLALSRCNMSGGASTTAKFLDNSGTGITWMTDCWLEMGANTASTISAGSLQILNCKIYLNKFTTSGAGLIVATQTNFGDIDNPGAFTYITTAGTGTSILSKCYIATLTATSISVGAGTTVQITNSTIESSNAAVIDGTGTLNYAGLSFTGSSSAITTTTQNIKHEGPSRIIGAANIGNVNYLGVSNTDNTSTTSGAYLEARSGGLSGGDPYVHYIVGGGNQEYAHGIDVSDSETWKLNAGGAVSSGTTLFQIPPSGDGIFPGTGALLVNSGTTLQKPSSPVNGMIRYDTDLAYIEGYSNGTWKDLTQSGGGGITWTVETGNKSMSVNEGYFSNSASDLEFTLPDTAAVGDIVHVIGMGAGLFKIAQNASETISFPTATTTAGVTGSVTSLDQYCSLELICNVADTSWIVKSSTGSFTTV